MLLKMVEIDSFMNIQGIIEKYQQWRGGSINATVQAGGRARYERTTDPKRMMVHSLLNEAIRTDFENIKGVLPARVGTCIRYDKGATTAIAWNEGGSEIKINLPFEDGWYVPDGNPFAIPNGKPSNRDNPDALHLWRYQDRKYAGPLGRGHYWCDGDTERRVHAEGIWSDAPGVALVAGTLPDIADPKALVQRAEQLEAAAKGLAERLGTALDQEGHARFIRPILDEAAFLRELAGKLPPVRQEQRPEQGGTVRQEQHAEPSVTPSDGNAAWQRVEVSEDGPGYHGHSQLDRRTD
jgi:hypothetical protein